jgi:hypothetical protein
MGPKSRVGPSVSKRALQLLKLIEIYTEDIQNVLNCQNVAKHTEVSISFQSCKALFETPCIILMKTIVISKRS